MRPIGRVLGRPIGRQLGTMSGVFGGFTLFDLEGLEMLYLADTGALGATSLPVVDGEVYTLVDEINARNLTPASAGFRPSRDSDGGPNGIPVITFLADALRTASSFSAITNFTFVYLGRHRSTGFTAGERCIASDLTPIFTFSRNALSAGNGTCTVLASSGGSGNRTIPADQWMLFVGECVGGAGATSLNDGQYLPMSNPSAFQPDTFCIGDYAATASLCMDQDVVAIAVVSGTLSDAEKSKLRTYAANLLGLTFSNETRFEDTFTRADTGDNQLGIGETGHKWEGSSVAARILNNTLTIVSPWNTNYSWAQINFAPTTFGWDYTTRNEGGAVREVAATLITKARQNLNDMFHLVWSTTGWKIEQYLFSGTVTTHVVEERTYAAPYLAGSVSVRADWDAGLLWITGADGVEIECDWNGSTATEPLINYKTPYLCYEVGIQSAGTPDDVIQYDRCWANK